MRKLTLLLIAILPFLGASGDKPPQPAWELHLTGEGGIFGFARPQVRTWMQEQGVVFLSPTRLAIYQVNRKLTPAPLSRRKLSGGGGNFFLLARVLDTETGQEIKRLEFVTTADFSSILPTHDGKFIVRAGDIMELFSADFTPLMSWNLPLDKHAQVDYWQVGVTPTGTQVALVHQQRFVDPVTLQVGAQTSKAQSQADVEMLDADTFQSVRKLHLSFYLPAWVAHERFLLTTEPNRPLEDTEFGILDFEGHWKALRPAWLEHRQPCAYKIDLLEHDLMAGYGCGILVVFAESGEKRLIVNASLSDNFASTAGADHYLALETEKPVSSLYAMPYMQPSQLQVYDLNSGERTLSVKLQNSAVSYAVSTQGVLAVVDGDALRVYKPESH
jgi:hypothetical protein